MSEDPLTVEGLVDFVERERAAAAAEEEIKAVLGFEELVARGDAIQGLTIGKASPDRLVLNCTINESRLRIGDRIKLQSSETDFTTTITDLRNNGCEVHVQPVASAGHLGSGPWIAQALTVDISTLVIACLRKLKPGAPGWSFLRACSGEALAPPLPVSENVSRQRYAIANAILSAEGADASQEAILLRCIDLPQAFGTQGPPGTGKTRVLAMVAEALAGLGKRTVVLAPTHQAVNHALSTIRRCFPGRRVVKVGDELKRESLDSNVECQLFADGTRKSGMPVSASTVTGMTFVSALHHLILRKSALAPNVVLIDEAGQLPLAQGICAGLSGAGSILMFGDDAQMPPVFPGALVGDPLAESLLARFSRSQPADVSMLQTTYRLNAELCGIIGSSFYPSSGGTHLRSSREAGGRRFSVSRDTEGPSPEASKVLASEASFVWIRSPAGKDQQTNPVEAYFVANLIRTALQAGICASQVAVVTPFRRQAALIRNVLQAQLSERTTLPIIDTVERVQGLSVELAVLSVSVSDPEYARTRAAFLLSPNRLNVALSRARTKAILVAAPVVLDVAAADRETRDALVTWRGLVGMAKEVVDLAPIFSP